MSIINKLISKITEDVIRFKQNGYKEKEVRRFINKDFVKSQLEESDEFCFVGNIEQSINEIIQQVNQIIKQEYYSEYNSKEYYAPKVKGINVDTDYEVKKVGNASEITFKDTDKIQGQDVKLEYSTDGRSCDLEQKFTKNGKLIATCKYNSDNEE